MNPLHACIFSPGRTPLLATVTSRAVVWARAICFKIYIVCAPILDEGLDVIGKGINPLNACTFSRGGNTPPPSFAVSERTCHWVACAWWRAVDGEREILSLGCTQHPC